MNAALGFLASRYLLSRRKHRGMGSSVSSFVGLSAGVVVLNSVLSVMNGFQLTYIESLMEVSSSHIRWSTAAPHQEALRALEGVPGVVAVLDETESQSLVSTEAGGERGAVVRGFPPGALTRDRGLAAHLDWESGGMPQMGEVALGSALAHTLGAYLGGTVRLTALTGAGFSLLAPTTLEYRLAGTFSTGYYDLDATWVILPLAEALAVLAGPQDRLVAIKLKHPEDASWMRIKLAEATGRPPGEFRSWDEFNSAFYGALRTEKTSMMVLVGLIFLVVGANLYFSQKRAVLEHREDLALLRATGTSASRLRLVFTLEGLTVGTSAAVVGTLAGWALSLALGSLGLFSSEAFYIPAVPARMVVDEVLAIAVACIASATVAAGLASAQVLRVAPGEVLKHA